MTVPNGESFKQYVISVKVENRFGVLARVAGLFSARGYNIDSLVVSPSMDGRYSRMTIAAKGSIDGLDQIIQQVSAELETAPPEQPGEPPAVEPPTL